MMIAETAVLPPLAVAARFPATSAVGRTARYNLRGGYDDSTGGSTDMTYRAGSVGVPTCDPPNKKA